MIYKALDSDVISEDEIYMKGIRELFVGLMWNLKEKFHIKVKVVEGSHGRMLNTLWGNKGPCYERNDIEIFMKNVKNFSNAGMTL